MSKPWDNEPTPLTKKAIIDSRGQWSFELRDAMANLERRMRAAEQLLKATIDGIYPLVPDHDMLFDDIKAHLEAAKKEDGQ